MKELLQQDLNVVNVGLQGFASNITAAGGAGHKYYVGAAGGRGFRTGLDARDPRR